MPKILETWQVWHAMRKTISDGFIMSVLGRRNVWTIRMYAPDPGDVCIAMTEAIHKIENIHTK